MKKILFYLILIFGSINGNAQSCEEMMDFVKSKSYGSTYTSYNSDAIFKVTFYDVMIDYQTYYFAIVCFKKEYSYSCNEYIYQVASSTKFNYSLDHYESAGKAFQKHIQPYNDNLGCAPNFNQNDNMKYLLIICATFLLLGLAELPIGFYTILRIIITIGAISVIISEYESGLNSWIIVFGFVAIIFNPLIPVYLNNKNIWIPIDIITSILFIIKIITIKTKKYE